MTIFSECYTEADRSALREFMMAMRASGAAGCWHVGDLAWGVFFLSAIASTVTENLRLWREADGRLLGFAHFFPREGFVLVQTADGAQKWTVEQEALAWADTRRKALAPPGGVVPPLHANAFANDPARMAFLEAQRFVQSEGYVHFTCALTGPLPAPELPSGFSVRLLAGEAEVARRALAHRQAFGSERVTEAQYHRLRAMPEYAPELDIVAVAPDGAVGAFCLGWIDPVNKISEFEPVGTAPAYQRLGLGKAVLREGLRRMQALGMQTAFVCTEHDNLAAQQLYRAAGFEACNLDFDYTQT